MRKVDAGRLISGEKGYILIAALLVLVVVGLMSGPLLSFMVSGLGAGHVFEVGATELYGADAGVQDAILRIQNGIGLCEGSPTTRYTIADVNGKNVDVTVTWVYNTTETVNYRVESIAETPDDDSQTKITAYVTGVSKYGDYSGILGQVLTSQQGITLQPGTEVYPPEGEEHGPEEYYADAWPTAEELADFYHDDVAGESPYSSGTFDIAGFSRNLGPMYRNGAFTIVNSSNTPATLTLTGTLYITGDTLIGTTGKDFTLDLNGQTIFIESSKAKYALEIGGKCGVEGSGVIVATGGIYFEPKIPVGITDPVFVMSVEGTTFIQPNGAFYGSVAGSVEVQLQPGSSIGYPDDEGWYSNLNFLIGIQKLVYGISSYEVSRE